MSNRKTPVETDPLGAIGAELVGAARRQTAARRRRQRATTAVATAMMMLVSVAGASALIGGTTGVPVVDSLVERIDSSHDEEQTASRQADLAATSPAVTPASSDSASEPIEVPSGDGAKSVAVAYVSQGGQICFAMAEPHGEGVSEARGGGVSDCVVDTTLARRLADDDAYITGVSFGEAVVVNGYAAADVEGVAVDGPDGRLTARLGEPWTPDLPDAEAVRPFVAYITDPELVARAKQRDIDPRDYSIVARMEGGRVEGMRP